VSGFWQGILNSIGHQKTEINQVATLARCKCLMSLSLILIFQKSPSVDRSILDPLLVKLDWVFTSATWNLSFPTTNIQPLSRPISDHTPFVINIGTKIPKAATFRSGNHWVEHDYFLKIVDLHWNNAPYFSNSARNLSQRMKQVRHGLKVWSKSFSNLGKLIHNCNWVLLLLDGLEEQRTLSELELALRNMTKRHLAILLERKRTYWRQRNTIRWVKFGDENTSFFQALAT